MRPSHQTQRKLSNRSIRWSQEPLNVWISERVLAKVASEHPGPRRYPTSTVSVKASRIQRDFGPSGYPGLSVVGRRRVLLTAASDPQTALMLMPMGVRPVDRAFFTFSLDPSQRCS